MTDEMKRRLDFAVARLRSGKPVDIETNMGSCQCGSHSGNIAVVDGAVVAHCEGWYGWQNFDGPAVNCNVSYGWGATARAIAQSFNGQAVDTMYAFSQGTGFRGCTLTDWKGLARQAEAD